ncbi:MAG: serine protease [Nitrospirae bacterium]|nr:MAG: serine protease [Nitrospirota bacterium]
MARRPARLAAALTALALLAPVAAPAAALPETVARVAPAVVAVGSWALRRTPPSHYLGTGFAVADGRHCLTNAHVVAPVAEERQAAEVRLAVFSRGPGGVVRRGARVVAEDRDHDLALLAFDGPPLPALHLGDSRAVRPGEAVAITGFPIGMVLGLHPATHAGIVAAVVPVTDPALSSRRLTPQRIRQLRHPFPIFQLDLTAYPGNSGSPLYRPATGEVVGVVNAVLAKKGKESALTHPSGISYALPIHLARPLLARAGLAPE